MVKQHDGLRIVGGGILSSPKETQYALESDVPVRRDIMVTDVLRTPYRIDILQPLYYILENFDQLLDISEMDLMALVQEAKQLGLFEPLFEPKKKAS